MAAATAADALMRGLDDGIIAPDVVPPPPAMAIARAACAAEEPPPPTPPAGPICSPFLSGATARFDDAASAPHRDRFLAGSSVSRAVTAVARATGSSLSMLLLGVCCGVGCFAGRLVAALANGSVLVLLFEPFSAR
eukprot:CAMPEP_0172606896 /NCGR_PEP_ID=MMETSP1068-20121228/27104_1 /TAXON_ID=35684 /ORGANISM="Pseudopedinella elastica, Strain CCMP716" /LENGTH=135 /DNA_ID=CAMNT_0013409761 /DNA_START=212 /DNA_END=619 /DNA_ORIENTATION=-